MNDDQIARAVLVGVFVVLLRPYVAQGWEKVADGWELLVEKAHQWRRRSGPQRRR